MKKKIFCTIMTPTYNRGYLLIRLYNSLLNQSEKDFEWIIVDDGSDDDTKEVVNKFINKKNGFNIKYYYQNNGGKHRAVNKGIDFSEGEVFAIVDSDDYLTKNAVEEIKKGFSTIKDGKCNLKFAGVGMLKGYSEDEYVGKTFKYSFLDAKSTERKKRNIIGDKFEVFYTSVMRENKFPEVDEEKFMTEAIVWNRIANKGYYIRWYNKIVYICQYLENGLTDSREKLIEESPIGYAMYIKELVKFHNITLKEKLGYYSFYAYIRKKTMSIKEISKELNTSAIMINLSLFLRKIVYLGRNKNEKK